MGIIYILTSSIGKSYIGQTINSFRKRIREHKHMGNIGSDFAIHRAIKKYGIDSFCMEIFEVKNEKLDDIEKIFIEKYNTICPNGYNIMNGGNSNKKHTEEIKEKISRTLKKRYQKMRSPFYGCKHTETAKDKISKSKKGKSSLLKDKKRSIDVCKKISKTKMGKYSGKDNNMSKPTILIHPDGKEEMFESLRKSCKKYNLSCGILSEVISGKFKQHKGFKAYYI